MAKRGKIVALSTAVAALVVIAAGVFTTKDWIREQWLLRRLASGDEAEENAAARQLLEVGSYRSIKPVLEIIKRRRTRTMITWNFAFDGKVLSFVLKCIGGPHLAMASTPSEDPWIPEDEAIGTSERLPRQVQLADLGVYRCLFALCERAGDAALPALSEAAGYKDDYVPYLALCLLVKHCKSAEVMIPRLIAALDSPHAPTQQVAVLCLRRYASQASVEKEDKRAALALLELLRRRDEIRRDTEGVLLLIDTTRALGSLGSVSEVAVSEIIEIVEERATWKGAEGVPGQAITALGMIGPAAKAAVPVLSALAEQRDRPLKIQAIRALAGIGPEARDAVPALKRALKDTVPSVQMAVQEALKKIEGKSVEAPR